MAHSIRRNVHVRCHAVVLHFLAHVRVPTWKDKESLFRKRMS